MQPGHIHPISSLIREANAIFGRMGFSFEEGPLLEDEWHNFDSLNVPKDHPARDMQDTFFIKNESGMVLRTHTSPVQVRYMQKMSEKGTLPPYRIIVPGKVFRNEATDMTHEAEFFQIEGLAVGEDVSLANLKGTLSRFFKELFGGAFRRPQTEALLQVDPGGISHEGAETVGVGDVLECLVKFLPGAHVGRDDRFGDHGLAAAFPPEPEGERDRRQEEGGEGPPQPSPFVGDHDRRFDRAQLVGVHPRSLRFSRVSKKRPRAAP